ncbi:MAG: polysaccharide deacetylase family protein [Erysipelotrichaceae bacterium]|nr:polysaccharide deacetylase family protein [Erysipelotrichaceae bacterium]
MKKREKKIKLIMILSGLVILGLVMLLWTKTEFTGVQPETIELYSTYEDTVTATRKHVLLPFWKKEVAVSGEKPDTSVLGEQLLLYQAGHAKVVKKLTVVDTVKPIITLVESSGYVVPGQTYQEDGYSASDNYDGDLTNQVQRREYEDRIVYTVKDSSGNTAKAERIINYTMKKAPKLTVKNQTLTVGDKFVDSYSATDEGGNDITDKVVMTGTVDTKTVGTYTLKYSVTDDYGNKATKSATIKVKAKADSSTKPDPVTPGESNGKTIYLTFDDGPSGKEPALLDILKQYNVKATFFITGNGSKYRDNLTRMHKEGHVVAVHSYTHVYKSIYKSSQAYWADFQKCQDLIYKYTGTRPTLFRFPGGSSNTVSKSACKGIMTKLAKESKEKGYTYFDWNVSSGDAGGTKTASGVFNNIKKGVAKKTNSVVLCHSTKSYTVEAMKQFIPWALENGYTFKVCSKTSPTAHHGINN